MINLMKTVFRNPETASAIGIPTTICTGLYAGGKYLSDQIKKEGLPKPLKTDTVELSTKQLDQGKGKK